MTQIVATSGQFTLHQSLEDFEAELSQRERNLLRFSLSAGRACECRGWLVSLREWRLRDPETHDAAKILENLT